MPEKWYRTDDGLPPDGTPIVARWADGETAPGVMVDAGSIWEWQLQTTRHDIPEAWRYDTPARHIGAKLLGSMSPALPIAIAGAAMLALAGFTPLALALLAAIIGLWAMLALVSVGTDHIMAKWGAWAALLTFLALGLALSAGVVFMLMGVPQ